MYSVNKMGSRESRSPWGQITDTFKEKLDTVVRGRRHSKEHSDRSVAILLLSYSIGLGYQL